MSATVAVEQWRAAYDDRRWAQALLCWDRVAAEDRTADDMEDAATAMWLGARYAEAVDLLTTAHERHLRDGDYAGATRAAVWISIGLADLGEFSRSGGWAARARSVAEELDADDPHRALAELPAALSALMQGQAEQAESAFSSALTRARVGGDGDVRALACLGSGQARIMRGRLAEGMSYLDEAMVAVTAGEVSLVTCGIIYCSVIEYCKLAWDLQRATEWTAALDRWCGEQTSMVTYQGQCEAHRADLMKLHGEWDAALECADRAMRHAELGDGTAQFSAPYQCGEILRLRGRFDEAEQAYSQAGETGWPPQPGLALLRLAQGRVAEASAQLRRTRAVVDPASWRSMLPAVVEVELAGGDVPAARAAADELRAMAASIRTPFALALADLAHGRVLRAEGDASGAIGVLQSAVRSWAALEAPYHAARARAELSCAYADHGDVPAWREARDTARSEFVRLGAVPAQEWCESERGPIRSALTPREGEVLRQLTRGLTNRQIARELTLSEKTVARHLENIYRKLDVPSRAAATAWAVERGLA